MNLRNGPLILSLQKDTVPLHNRKEVYLPMDFMMKLRKPLPFHIKQLHFLAGLGWIGKNNLLVTQEYGSAMCMCTVLTNAPLPTENRPIIMPKCGECTVCKDISFYYRLISLKVVQ